MKNAFLVVLAASALAGCAGMGEEGRKEPAFGDSFGWEWRGKDHPASPPAAATPASVSNPQGLSAEDLEFQDWRAWQEWKRRNPK